MANNLSLEKIRKKRSANRLWMKKWSSENLEEVKKRRRKQYLRRRKNPELWQKELSRFRQLRKDNLVSRRKYESKYRKENKIKLDAIARKYRKDNPQWIISSRLRTRVRLALKAKNVEKCVKTLDLIGCSIPELRVYLERQFKNGMKWSNIHIDHKIPIAFFDLTSIEEQRRAFHYSNMQPLFAQDNLSKGAKII